MKPQARTKGLVVRDLPGELIVYDLDRHAAHCLNETASTVFRHADGRHTRADLAELFDGPSESAKSVVDLALEQLSAAHLLEGEPASVAAAGVSRRGVLRQAALGAAVLLPLVTSVMAPAPAEAAASCVDNCSGQPDTTPCSCFGADPCTSTCLTGVCQPDGVC
jgi:hypothetical protein